MQIQINQPGILSTIQDAGRYGFRSQAVPVSGAMDLLSARIANIALGNEANAAVIEFTYANASFTTLTDILIAYAGDGAFIEIEKQIIPVNKPVFIPVGKIAKLVASTVGCRTYVAVAGGLDVLDVLGSKSTYVTAALGGINGRALQKGDVLNACQSGSVLSEAICHALKGDIVHYPNWSLSRQQLLPTDKKIIRVTRGPESTWFSDATWQSFFAQSFHSSSQSNRMGYRLEGPVLLPEKKTELLSTAVVPGTIQVTGSGQSILLMADCQTTGGYPRIAQVASLDIPLCGQLKPGDTIHFKEISYREAELLYFERERQLAQMADAIAVKFLK